MKRKYLLFSLLLAGSSLYAQEWPAVHPEARPATRWWWLGSAVDATNLTYNLEEYAKAGLGGVEITPIYGVQGNDKNNLPFLSWKKGKRTRQRLNIATPGLWRQSPAQ